MPPDLPRVAFYPCCSSDIRQPTEMLQGWVDEVIFCDLNPTLGQGQLTASGLSQTFWVKDARVALEEIGHIDVFFYRCDGTVEGGSGLFFLGATLFPILLGKMKREVCHIITDGSNSRGQRFQKMKRPSGLREAGKHIARASGQPFLSQGLTVFTVVNDR